MLKQLINREIITTGLAIFSMFFGAGNLMFPIKVGLEAGDKNPYAIVGFLLTGTLIPLIGLIAIILFQGDYTQFFYRLGRIPGFLFIFFCIGFAGPLIAMPRIVTLSYTMIAPFIPGMSLFTFSLVFLVLTFVATYKESTIVNFLGNIISPLLLTSLFIIIAKGYLAENQVTTTNQTALEAFTKNLVFGYQTLDLLAGILFSSVVITVLQKSHLPPGRPNFAKLALMSFQAGILGIGLLVLIYVGLSHLGAYHGHGLANINEGELFSTISFRVLGQHGALVIATAVLMACYSTIVALTAVNAEFLSMQLAKGKIGYVPAVIVILLLTVISSNFGLSAILNFSKPIITIVSPALIVITFCNVAYKIFNFRPIKVPVALTLLFSLLFYCIN